MSLNGSNVRWPRARFRKSSRSDGTGNGNCVGVDVQGGAVAIGDTKSPIEAEDTYAHFVVTTTDLNSLLAGIKSGEIV